MLEMKAIANLEGSTSGNGIQMRNFYVYQLRVEAANIIRVTSVHFHVNDHFHYFVFCSYHVNFQKDTKTDDR